MASNTPKKVAQIHHVLRERVMAGEWQANEKLPTDTELAEHLDCSVGTVGKAMALLSHEGLIERKARAGTRVLSTPDSTRGGGKPREADLDAFAFIYPSAQHEGIWRTAQGFQAAAHERNRRAVMLTTGTDYRKDAEYISRLSEFHVRGAAVYPIILAPEDQVAFSQLLIASKFPMVLASINLLGLGCPSVTADAFHAGYTMTRHLIGRGIKKIGYFSNSAGSVSMRDRYMGYRKAMEESALPMPPERVMLESAMHPNFSDPVREPTELARNYLTQAGDIEGVVCNTDYLSIGLMRAAAELGLRVPTDLKITGIDDFTLAVSGPVALTTYRVPYEEIGRTAFQILESRVSNHGVGPNSDIQIRGEIVVRQST